MRFLLYLFSLLIVFAGCQQNNHTFDASGSFEAVERIISAQTTGTILRFDAEEGMYVEAGKEIGQIDITNLQLQAEQVTAGMQALKQKTNNAAPQVAILQAQQQAHAAQVAALQKQLEVVDKEVKRFKALVAGEAATQKQLDDLVGQKSVLEAQLAAAKTQGEVIAEQIKSAKATVAIQNTGILSEELPTAKRLELIEKQIADGKIINQYAGTILAKYAETGEFTNIGKPLYKIADLSTLTLRAYITGNQLPLVKLNQKVTVLTDDGNGNYQQTEGAITWISDKAEFTPKTIQTKDERANMVYAIKVKVPNPAGIYKIGMYGELKF